MSCGRVIAVVDGSMGSDDGAFAAFFGPTKRYEIQNDGQDEESVQQTKTYDGHDGLHEGHDQVGFMDGQHPRTQQCAQCSLQSRVTPKMSIHSQASYR